MMALLTSIDANARYGSALNLLNYTKFIPIKYEYLVTLVVLKNAASFITYSGKSDTNIKQII